MSWMFIGAVAGAIAVALGAFGAHGLKDRISAEFLATFETGVRYQMYHALALVALGLLARTGSAGWWLTVAGVLFVAGIVVFSGCLYVMAFTGTRRLGAIVPLGGLCFILGWVALAIMTLPI